MNTQALKVLLLGCATLTLPVQANDFFRGDYGGYERHKGGWSNDYIHREREALNRERERLHREFDAQMRDLDRRNREIDRWQSGRHHNHQHIARIANEKREQLNRERERINRERDRMNREFDRRNRELDQHQQLAQRDRHHNKRHDHANHRPGQRYLWLENTCYEIDHRRGRKELTPVAKKACF